jgi:chorismate synthase
VIDGLPSGVRIDMDRLRHDMDLRRAAGSISTARKEADEVKFLSGVKDGIIEGTPLTLIIENKNVRRKDYDEIKNLARPGHADYTADVRYLGFQDASGGGHFSGRLTAPLTAAGSIVRKMLEEAEMNIAERLMGMSESELTNELITTIEERDIPEYTPSSSSSELYRRSNVGFAC